MDIRTQLRAMVLIRRMMDNKKCTTPIIATVPQKPVCRSVPTVSQPFPRSTPEAQGISSDHLAEFLEALQNDETLDPHSILILRNGKVIAEGAFGAYDADLWHITHSACKSITGLAVGMLIDEGRLKPDDSVVKIFEPVAPRLSLLTHKNLTVRHLLTMTSGIVFNETGAVTETDWVRCYLESAFASEPGKQFTYNSMNTYMLSAIIRQVSGQGLMEYLEDRLWGPLGITEIFWETCPKGIEKGGWGLYIRPEDIAKIGQLVLQKGRWGDRQLVSKSWIKEATTMKMETNPKLGDFNYGYQIWVGRERNSFLFNGMFSQNVIGFPDTGMLIVTNSGNDELFQQSNYFALLERFFTKSDHPVKALPENAQAHARLLGVENGLRRLREGRTDKRKLCRLPDGEWTPMPELCTLISGRTYRMNQSESASVGLLPLFAQAIQNNYTKGLESIGFEFSEGTLFLTVKEADECYRMAVGFDEPVRTDLVFHGEPYRVGVAGKFTTDEDDRPVLKIRVSFLEIANSRLIKIFFHKDRIVTKWQEFPGKPYLVNAMEAIMGEVRLFPFLQTVMSTMDSDFLRFKVGTILEPTVEGRLALEREEQITEKNPGTMSKAKDKKR